MSKRNSHGSLSKGSHNNVPDSRRTDRDDRRDREDRRERDDQRDDRREDRREEESSKKPKLAFGSKPPGKPPLKMSLMAPAKKGIQIKLGAQKPSVAGVKLQSASSAVSAAFNVDDDDEPEEMPPEARMRMRNIGRETPTSAGPNSFGKTKQGFCDNKKMFEKTMKKAMDGSIIKPPRPDSGSE